MSKSDNGDIEVYPAQGHGRSQPTDAGADNHCVHSIDITGFLPTKLAYDPL